MIVITGQTATGKTNLALKYAKKYNGELVNFDSRQVYKYLDIITGKDILPTKIWLYDVVKPNKYYSYFEYIKDAQKIIKDIIKRGKTPILVGGSYFYLKHLLYGFDYKVKPNFKLRTKLNKKTVEELQKILTALKSQIAKTMNHSDWNNPRRLIRRIEILKANIPFREKFSNKLFFEKMVSSFIGLRYKNKEKLRETIKARVMKRLKQGAVKEVEKLLKKGYKKTNPGLKTIGYKQIIEYLEKKISLKQTVEKWINAEMQYAKRQYTLMKKDPYIKWEIIS